MTDQPLPYYLTEEFCREHGHKGPAALAREFPETGPSSWANRRTVMRTVWEEFVPMLDKRGRVIKTTAQTAPLGRNEIEDARREERREESGINSDGSHFSDRLVEMNAEQSKDPVFLLQAHGFDPAEWELSSARNNIWNVFSKDAEGDHNISTLYSSRIVVKPKTPTWTVEDLVAAVSAAQTPVTVKRPKSGKRLLELPYTDMHFGNSTIADYRSTLAYSLEHIRSRKWQQTVVWIGSDFYHCDNFKNTTSNGTPQSSMWWPEAVKDGLEFIGTVIEACLEQSVETYVYYIPGNHDESMTWMFALMLEHRYPQAVFDTRIENRKVHLFADCAIGMTHGTEKTRKDLDRVFAAEYPKFSAATHREVHMGHLHHEKTVDHYGVMTRSLPTSARTDKWHRESGYVGAHKTFLLFEWEAGRGITDPHYV